MGLLDQVMGAVAGASGPTSADSGDIVGSIMQLLNNPQSGGIGGLIQSFRNGGLGEVVSSWISTGQNLPISAAQIQSVLGSSQVQEIAGKLGISTEHASRQLAEFLPQIIDQLSPNGTLPEGSALMAQGLELLKGKFFA